MKWIAVILLTFFLQANAISATKATRGELIEAFDGKFVMVEGRSHRACFSVKGNSIKGVEEGNRCDRLAEIDINSRGLLCIENTDGDSNCAKVRILSNGDFAWGKRKMPITIYDTREALTGGALEVDNKSTSLEAKKFYRQASKLYKKKKYFEAAKLFKKSAALGFSKAQARYAYALEKGKGEDKDIKQAMSWYEKAAIQGYTRAQFRLGNLYRKKGEYTSAVEWFRKAADNGSAGAQNNIGYMYKNGTITGSGDNVEAIKWYMMSAEGGNKVGQYNVCAILYNKGAYMYDEAKKWCERSAGQGYSEARRLIERMDEW